MLQDLSADRHTAWQLQNGAFMQPSDWSHCVSVVDNILLSRQSTLLRLLERQHELHQILYLKNESASLGFYYLLVP